ncbi:MAG: helix-turn-helix domain-containing protein [Acidaminococcus intestini]|jgi:hypothetical protein|uniref:helix-turn-helix domain-containing protein n=1 Tax=Acidaminococcus TaxID=904 RepID=UPI001D025116|nr:helix-turn-helix transcriptional regulator [Acidaminococcus intestini]MCB5829387.1 helix-turn-helix transcriptional regulator [Acidaminococcus intestini]MCG4851595.1 helix-turn-helix transcriptional regulator [Acidaminococcus intestini]
MSTDEAIKMMNLIGDRLSSLLQESGISQTELSEMLGVSRSTVNKWIMKKALPRMGLIEKMSSIFGVPKSYFLEEVVDDRRAYYLNPETAEMAEKLRTNEGLRMLFKASEDLPPEKMQEAYSYVKYLKSKEPK